MSQSKPDVIVYCLDYDMGPLANLSILLTVVQASYEMSPVRAVVETDVSGAESRNAVRCTSYATQQERSGPLEATPLHGRLKHELWLNPVKAIPLI